jgi:acetolactate synthase-1/3 small subunit
MLWHTWALRVTNHTGVLTKVVSLFSHRGYNIQTLHVEPMPGSELSTIHIEGEGGMDKARQITMQMHKLEDVKEVAFTSADDVSDATNKENNKGENEKWRTRT